MMGTQNNAAECRSYETAFMAGLLFLIVCNGCSTCSNRILSQVTSPNGLSKAVVFERSCGATTGFSVQVSLLQAEAGVPVGRGNIFIVDDNHGAAPLDCNGGMCLSVHWQSERDLLVRYPPRARVFLRQPKQDGVRITYEVAESPPAPTLLNSPKLPRARAPLAQAYLDIAAQASEAERPEASLAAMTIALVWWTNKLRPGGDWDDGKGAMHVQAGYGFYQAKQEGECK